MPPATDPSSRSAALITALSRVAAGLETGEASRVMQALGVELQRIGIESAVALKQDDIGLVLRHFSKDTSLLHAAEQLVGMTAERVVINSSNYPPYREVVELGRPVFVRDPEPAVRSLFPQVPPESLRRAQELMDMPPGTPAANLPLLAGGRVIGVLFLWGQAIQESDLPALSVFASQVAISIEQGRLIEEVRKGRQRLEALSAELLRIQEHERRSIARELHDEIGQSLTGLKLLLETALGQRDHAPLRDALTLITDLQERVRDLSLDFRPAALDDFGLVPALDWHLDRVRAQTGLHVTFEHAGLHGRRFGMEVETAVFRIVQEAVTNVVRHAGIREAALRISVEESLVRVDVEDRGRGFPRGGAGVPRSRRGLTGMRERARLLGGRLRIDSIPGAGTRVQAEIPLRPPA